VPERARILLASSNAGKLAEFETLAASESHGAWFQFALLPNFSSLPTFEESAPTFAENAVGKAIHYSRTTEELVLADDSGLVVPALGDAPGVHSARYAGPGASDGDRIRKLLSEMKGKTSAERAARFVCVLALAQHGRAIAIVSDLATGELLTQPRGDRGFGYDPVFLLPEAGKTFAELTRQEKNRFSHRGKAFRRLFADLAARTAPNAVL
jgi:XTP/dITP diphosphohydrolase